MLRTYGRVTNLDGSRTWVTVTTAANGDESLVWLTTLAQVIQLNLNEAPFNADYGIPAVPSVISQVFPDFYMTQIQRQFSQYFASLIISKLPGRTPTYNVAVTTLAGAQLTMPIAT